MSDSLSIADIEELLNEFNVVPVSVELSAKPDLVSVWEDVVQQGAAALFESADQVGYSWLAWNPEEEIALGLSNSEPQATPSSKFPRSFRKPFLRSVYAGPGSAEPSPGFMAGGIGFFSYDFSRRLEVIPTLAKDDLHIDDAFFLQ